MSKKKNRKNRNHNGSNSSVRAEQLSEQLNAPDEQNDAISPETEDILEKYERMAAEAQQRKEERQKRAEEAARIAAEAEARAELERRKELEKAEAEDNEEAEEVKEFIPKVRNSEPEIISEISSHEPAEGFTDGIDEALGEDVSELSEPEENDTAEVRKAERPNRFYLVFAIFVIIMSVIGVISTVNFFAGVISDIANQTVLKKEISLFLYPVVSVDPPGCDDVTELPPSIIIESAIWKIILTGDNTNYEKQYNTYMYVPAVDVEFAVRSIFGNSVKIEHQTVGSLETTFRYTSETNSYLVPINPHYTAYSPRITNVSNIGELYTVTVDYVPPSALSMAGKEYEADVTKTMVYTLSKSRNSTTLHAIKNETRIEDSYEY